LMWQILATNGMETKFAPLPQPHAYIIGTETIGGVIYLFTIDTFYRAPLSPVPSTFTQTTDSSFPLIGMFLEQASLVDVNPLTPNVAYFSANQGFGGPTLYTYRFTPQAVSTVPFQGFSSLPKQMFFSTGLGTIIATNDSDFLFSVDLLTGVTMGIYQTPPGTVAATVFGDYYYAANTTHAIALNVKTKKLLWCNKINGAPILGPFVYISL